MPHYKTSIFSKLPKVGTTIFTKMSELSNQHGALNLSQGFPDFDIDMKLVDEVEKYMRKGFNQYAPMPGLMKLREKIASKLYSLYGIDYHPNQRLPLLRSHKLFLQL